MKLINHAYTPFNLTRVIMAAGESFTISAAENDKSIGVLCVRGGTQHSLLAVSPPVHLPQADDGFLLNAGETAWSNDAVGHHDLALYAPVDTEWVCVSENGHGRPVLDHAMVNGDSVLQPGTGVIVVSGQISVDGVTGGPDSYFRPRERPVVLSGQGEAILSTSQDPKGEFQW